MVRTFLVNVIKNNINMPFMTNGENLSCKCHKEYIDTGLGYRASLSRQK